MHVQHVEIGNYRKLKAVRIDLASDTTVLVGANNSGKTSAMNAMRSFLVERGSFSIHDFTLSNWPAIDDLGSEWERRGESGVPEFDVSLEPWLPHMDVWLSVQDHELHHVSKLLPHLDWDGEPVGVRLRLEPKDFAQLQQSYVSERLKAKEVLGALGVEDQGTTFSPWPRSLTDYLGTKLRTAFEVRAYLLEPSKLEEPKGGIASPQKLPAGSEPIDAGDPFRSIIRIDEIRAQRGFGLVSTSQKDADEADRGFGATRLSGQLRAYYKQHLDPSVSPAAEDARALLALHEAQQAFSRQLDSGFQRALNELQGLGYPGVTDPKLKVMAKVDMVDGLNHPSAVQYEVPVAQDRENPHRLPEGSNGLGYQNLVSIVFALMGFRDKWMRAGKAGSSDGEDAGRQPPLHLVLIEEPEAHLHAQVQQVFIKQAYGVLRNHPELQGSDRLRTQLLATTHSNHVAHELDFAALRYFRRLPVSDEAGSVPVSCVANLTHTFGREEKTAKFVQRYLKATHCDLFFADGAILVEGQAERLLVPHFVRSNEKHSYLDTRYITWLEVGGSHAHRLRPLLEQLGINALIITDIDAKDGRVAVPPTRGRGLKSRNATLKSWIPGTDDLDKLLDMKEERLQIVDTNGGGIRVAYQQPVIHEDAGGSRCELLPNTFEDAVLYSNLSVFKDPEAPGMVGKFSRAIDACGPECSGLPEKVHGLLETAQKAEFALDLLGIEGLAVPEYIESGLLWLQDQLKRRERRLDDGGEVAASSSAKSKEADAGGSE